MPKHEKDPVNEGGTCVVEFPVQDLQVPPVNIPKSSITSATMIGKTRDGSLVPGLHTGGAPIDVMADIDAAGDFSRFFAGTENVMVDGNTPDIKSEVHILTFEIKATLSGNAHVIPESVWFEILNLKHG